LIWATVVVLADCASATDCDWQARPSPTSLPVSLQHIPHHVSQHRKCIHPCVCVLCYAFLCFAPLSPQHQPSTGLESYPRFCQVAVWEFCELADWEGPGFGSIAWECCSSIAAMFANPGVCHHHHCSCIACGLVSHELCQVVCSCQQA
jgi:hypothetical protein